jgi:hypothetical protein
MPTSGSAESSLPGAVRFGAADVSSILVERGWYTLEELPHASMDAWLTRAADLLAPHSADRAALEVMLSLVFRYDAAEILARPESQEVLMRTGAREVIRELANRVLDGGIVNSDRFKEIVDAIKAAVPHRSRVIFHPIRLALAGRSGEGELDRVILLIDAAGDLPFAVKVKPTRERMLEFCAALD